LQEPLTHNAPQMRQRRNKSQRTSPPQKQSRPPIMLDPADAIGKARAAMTERAELPGMSLMEHLDELRRRIVHSAIYLGLGFFICWFFRDRIVGFLQAPLNHIGKSLVFTHPMDALNLDLQAALLAGAILASPFILYQVWLFIAPGLYQKERRFVVPFMAATVGLFLTGAGFGYFYVLPAAIKILIVGFGHNFTPMVTIEDYTSFFLSVILGLGISFELPILIFFLAIFGIVSPQFLWKNIRYAILAVFLVAAIITPSPDPWTMCIYAIPMLALYLIGIGVAWWVHPSRRKAKEAKEAAQ
jgi:sec-independent protein translocase protein TatC